MVTLEQNKVVKARGFLPNRDKQHYSARIITENGVLTADQMQKICEVARKFGNGEMAFTTRLTVELQGIKYEDIQKVEDCLAKDGLVVGGTGAKVRPIVCCKGTVCVFGNLDTQGLATKMHKKFFEGYKNVTLPHKFKIAIGGCPNNCVKPELNDIGIVGIRPPKFDLDKCKGCKKCAVSEVCPMNAASVKDKKLSHDRSLCNLCGRCIDKCYFKIADQSQGAVRIYIGGRWGKKTRHGSLLSGIYTEEQAIQITEQAILYFKANAYKGERFAELIERVGVENAEIGILNMDIQKQKEEIIDREILVKG